MAARDPDPAPQRQGHHPGPPLAVLDPRARRLARRPDDGDGVRPPEPVAERRRPPVLRHADQEVPRSRTSCETPPLGHQDPGLATGRQGAAVRPQRARRAKGAPVIYRYDVAKKKGTPLTGPGYLEPSYSPDGQYIAATKQSSFGTDLVILDAANGREVLRLTNDGSSWAPVWSPTGDAIAFLHIRGQIVDLELIRLAGAAPDWTVKDVIALTEVSGLDGDSRPGWFVPAERAPRRARRRLRARRLAPPPRPPLLSDDHVPRAAGRPDGGGRQRPVPRPRSGPGPAAGGLLPGRGRRRALRPAAHRGGRPVRCGDQAEPRLLRGARVGRPGRTRADPRVHPGRHPGRHRCQAGRHRHHRGSPRRRPLRPARRRRGHGQPVSGRRGDRSRCSSAPTATPTSCAGRRTRRRPSSRTWSWQPIRRPGHRPSRSTCASLATPRRGGRAGRSGSSSAPRHPPSCARSGPRRQGSASSSRASAPRAARSSRSSRTVRRRRHRPGQERGVACW